MKLNRRAFLKTGGTVLASLLAGGRPVSVRADHTPRLLPGREVPGRCPLCSLGCGVIYRYREHHMWHVEGDPDCPVAAGSLCSRGAALTAALARERISSPLYRAPGEDRFREIGWEKAVDLLARRIKDLRDRDLGLLSEDLVNRFDSLGLIAGGCLTNEEAYLLSKFFRALGVLGMDTTVRASHGMAVSGLLDTLGLPAGTHPVTQVAYSDVVVLMGCNPGQTSPAFCRFLDRVRERRGTVIVMDPRRSETIKRDDLWLQLRPGTDNAVMGAFLNWILSYAEIRKEGLLRDSDAGYMVLSEIMGVYRTHETGKLAGRTIVDESLSEPYSIFQRMKAHFKRYDLRRVSGITGVDVELMRRACTLLARTVSPHFSATFVIGSGALASPSGADSVRMAAAMQALLGNLDKKGGGVVLPAAAGNAQGVCDMGLLAPHLPGYIPLPRHGREADSARLKEPMEALSRAWYPSDGAGRALDHVPRLEKGENPSVSTILQGVVDERIRVLVTAGSDPLGSTSDSSSVLNHLDHLDLLVVMDSTLNSTARFWSHTPGRESAIKTEVLFIPTEPPALKNGSMTDPGRRVRRIMPAGKLEEGSPGFLEFLVLLGNSIRSKYEVEGGVLSETVLSLSWPLKQTPESVAAEINGWREGQGGESELPPGPAWKPTDRCGNHLYRGWIESGSWNAERRDPSDPKGIGLRENWGWFWPWGVADPFSWIRKPGSEPGSFLRWEDQEGPSRTAGDVLPLRPLLPVKFWKIVESGSPLPEHYEPFHSPLPDFLTGGRSNPNMQLRVDTGNQWGYLSRRPDEVLDDYPSIITVHRTGNVMGTGGITARPAVSRELGVCRVVEIGKPLAAELGVDNGDRVLVISPYWIKGVAATALVTGRLGSYSRDGVSYHVASLTLYGEEEPGTNVLTPPAFDFETGGMEVKVFMGRIVKA